MAIILTFEGELAVAAYLLTISCACDFFDGLAARLLNVKNPLGAQLDSLVDMVAFGVAPGMLMYVYISHLQKINPSPIIESNPWLIGLTFFIPILAAFRLAKFNIDTRQTSSFIGLAVPAHASFYIFTVLVYLFPDVPKVFDANAYIFPIITNPLIMLILCVLLSFMQIAEVPMFSLKVKNLKWSENQTPLSFLFILIGLSLLINIAAFPVIIVLYIVWSIIAMYLKKSKS